MLSAGSFDTSTSTSAYLCEILYSSWLWKSTQRLRRFLHFNAKSTSLFLSTPLRSILASHICRAALPGPLWTTMYDQFNVTSKHLRWSWIFSAQAASGKTIGIAPCFRNILIVWDWIGCSRMVWHTSHGKVVSSCGFSERPAMKPREACSCPRTLNVSSPFLAAHASVLIV